MKLAHNIEMRVFCKERDNEKWIVKKIKELFPFDFAKEKVEFKSKISYGFEDNKIKVYTVFAKKQRQTTEVLKNFMKNLNKEQKDLLLKQINSRLDESLHFYIRLDKDKLLENEYYITDSGNCFHFKICIAAYPHKRDVAIEIVKQIVNM